MGDAPSVGAWDWNMPTDRDGLLALADHHLDRAVRSLAEPDGREADHDYRVECSLDAAASAQIASALMDRALHVPDVVEAPAPGSSVRFAVVDQHDDPDTRAGQDER